MNFTCMKMRIAATEMYFRAVKMEVYVVKTEISTTEMGITAVKQDNSNRVDKRFSAVNEHLTSRNASVKWQAKSL